MYTIAFTQRARQDFKFFERSQPHIYKKARKLLEELALHPKTGTGKPKQLNYDLKGQWSRRIDEEHRMVYTIDDDVVKVEVLRMRYHYE